jgi:hypothetical protein
MMFVESLTTAIAVACALGMAGAALLLLLVDVPEEQTSFKATASATSPAFPALDPETRNDWVSV